MANKVWVMTYYGIHPTKRMKIMPKDGGPPIYQQVRDMEHPFFYEGYYREDPTDLTLKPSFTPDIKEALMFSDQLAGETLLSKMQGDFQIEEKEMS